VLELDTRMGLNVKNLIMHEFFLLSTFEILVRFS
jgi:hypothetical protein